MEGGRDAATFGGDLVGRQRAGIVQVADGAVALGFALEGHL
jgi:hypothetical protein